MITTKIKDVEELYKTFGAWTSEFDTNRIQVRRKFPFSVVTEGACDELAMAVQWCLDNVGMRQSGIGENVNFRKLTNVSSNIKAIEGDPWTDLWYEKTGYDYGVAEFFFKSESDLSNFESTIPKVYSAMPDGSKWKTNGLDKDGRAIEFEVDD